MNNECLIQWNQLKRENDPREELDLITLERSIEDYRQKSTEFDEQVVRITIRRIRNVVKHKDSENLSVRKSARKVLKSLRHSFQTPLIVLTVLTKNLENSRNQTVIVRMSALLP